MAQNIFKLYDGRTHFWQWDTGQKLIVLDERVTEVRLSNRDMEHSKSVAVHIDSDGTRWCRVPDILLQLPKNLIAYACAEDENGARSTIKSVKFAVLKQPIPANYVCEQEDDIEEKLAQMDSKIDNINATKADDIYYNEESQSIQLVADGELIGNPVDLQGVVGCSIVECKIDENGHLIVVLLDGRVIDAGYVGADDGVVFTPHISEDFILSWTNNGGFENPEPVDLYPFDEWSTLPEEGVDSEYEWEMM